MLRGTDMKRVLSLILLLALVLLAGCGAKTVTVKGPSKVKRVLKGLKQGKTYYVKVAPYKSVDGKAYIGQQSGAKKARAA